MNTTFEMGFNDEIALRNKLKNRNYKTFLDIGANVGIWAVDMAPYCEKVICFEPNKEAFADLLKNTASFANIECHNVAVSDYTGKGKLTLYTYSSHSSLDDTNPVLSENPKGQEEVEVITIDDFLKDKDYVIELVKIDVEGGENKVLAGMLETTKKFDPIFQVEYHR